MNNKDTDPLAESIKNQLFNSLIDYKKNNPDANANDYRIYLIEVLMELLLEFSQSKVIVEQLNNQDKEDPRKLTIRIKF